jgi:hypothetical protein
MNAFRALVLTGLFLLLPAVAWAQFPAELVGTYQMELETTETMELRSDGTAVIGTEVTRWAVRGKQLIVGSDAMPYAYRAGRLVLSVGPAQLAWRKLGATGSTSAAPSSGQKTMPVAGNAQDDQYRQILMSSAWCSFTYNKVSGTSSTRRVVLRPDGIMTINSGAESYSSGQGGSYAGQSSNSNSMRWKYESLRLYLDDGSGAGFQDVGLTATRNSNGSIILMAAGREYAMCR